MREHGRFATREFQAGDEAIFRELNEEWIRRDFKLEAKDEHMFANPRQTILDAGGRIFFTLRDGQVLGCCALIYMAPGEFEVAKMAVAPGARGQGIGRLQLEAVIAEARAGGAKRLYLETNQVLVPALHLYEAVGFQRLPPEQVTPSPYARADVAMELWL